MPNIDPINQFLAQSGSDASSMQLTMVDSLISLALATAFGVVAVAVPHAERPALHLAVAISALPIIALGPIFQVSLQGDAPRAALAALAVFLTTMIGTMVGLRACDRTSLDMVRAFGGGTVTCLRKVRLRSMPVAHACCCRSTHWPFWRSASCPAA